MQQEAFLPIGTTIRDHYVVEDVLGKGKGDLVYLVLDRWATQNLFVLKERINPDKHARDHFLFEGVVLKRLHHPALQRVYRIFEENAGYRAYMLMQYIAGQDLETMHRQWPNRSFSLSLTLSLMAPIIEAVIYLHSQHAPIIHRDINPSNIIVLRSKRPVLVNFGIDTGYNSSEAASTSYLCSPGYGAPEQYKGETNPRTDLYALAATFYTLLTGIVPPDARKRTADLLNRGVDPLIRADEVTSSVPATLGRAIHRAMSLSSDERFSSVAEFWWALHGSSSSQSIESVVPFVSDEDTREVQSAPAEPAPFVSDEDTKEVQEQAQQATSESPVGPDASVPAPIDRPPDEDAEESKEQPHEEALEGLVGARFIAPPEPVEVPTGTGREGIESRSSSSPHGPYKLLSSLTYFMHLPDRGSRQRFRRPAALLLLMLVLAIPLSVGALLWSHAISSHSPAVARSTPIVVHKLTPTPARSTPTASSKAGAVYTGTIHDILANTSTDIFLTGLQLHPGNISGYLLIGNGLRGSGPFKGMFNAAQHVQFVVTDGAGRPIFSFEGGVHPDGNIAGSYCALNQSGQCAGNYGLWSASPAS